MWRSRLRPPAEQVQDTHGWHSNALQNRTHSQNREPVLKEWLQTRQGIRPFECRACGLIVVSKEGHRVDLLYMVGKPTCRGAGAVRNGRSARRNYGNPPRQASKTQWCSPRPRTGAHPRQTPCALSRATMMSAWAQAQWTKRRFVRQSACSGRKEEKPPNA